MSHVHINILIFQSLLMVFNRDMQVMSSCKQNHVLFIACNHGNWNVIMCIHDSFLTAHTPNSVVLVEYVVK